MEIFGFIFWVLFYGFLLKQLIKPSPGVKLHDPYMRTGDDKADRKRRKKILGHE